MFPPASLRCAGVRTQYHLRPYSPASRNWTVSLNVRRNLNKVTSYNASPDAPRQVPTPLAFVKSSTLDVGGKESSSRLFSHLAQRFATNGYSCLEVDQPLPSGLEEVNAFADSLDRAAGELNSSIKSSPIPFPPVLISHSLSSLISQAYVSSFSATALILVSPPPSVAVALSILRARPLSELGEIIKTDMKEFDFEPRFPIAVFVGKGDGSKEIMERECRLVKEGADLIEVELDTKSAERSDVEGRLDLGDLEEKMRDWMDEIGV